MWQGMEEKILQETVRNRQTDLEFLNVYQQTINARVDILQNDPSPPFLNIYDQLYGETFKALEGFGQDDVAKLITALSTNNEIRPQQTLIVSSMGKMDGCSHFVLNLARALQNYHQRSVIIDANIKSRGFTRFTRRHSEGLGLTDLIAGDAPIWRSLTRLDESEVFLLERGRNRKNAAKLLDENKVAEITELFRDLFNYIIIEVPPLLDESNLQLWAKRGDAIVLIENEAGLHSAKSAQIKEKIEDIGVEFWGTFKSSLTTNALRTV